MANIVRYSRRLASIFALTILTVIAIPVHAVAATIPNGYCAPHADFLSPLASVIYKSVISPEVLANSTVTGERLLTSCNHLKKVLVDGPEIFGQIRDEISNARYEVDLAFMTWDPNSQAAQSIGVALLQASSQVASGEKLLVRILVDRGNYKVWDAGNESFVNLGRPIDRVYDSIKKWQQDFGLDLNKVTIELATFYHQNVNSYPDYLGLLHDKYAVIDGKVVVITGANLEKSHDAPKPWHDTGYVLSGNVGLSVLSSFDQAWSSEAKHWQCSDRRFRRDCTETKKRPIGDRPWLNSLDTNSGAMQMLVVSRSAAKRRNNTTNNPQDQASEGNGRS